MFGPGREPCRRLRLCATIALSRKRCNGSRQRFEFQVAELDEPVFRFQAEVAPGHLAVGPFTGDRSVDP